ncbi:baseplate assembly protein, partial [Escherichia coli]|nr:baseplate assembly protein [Escherichia coli]
VLLYEPRVSLDRIEINKASIQDGILIIELYYTIRMNNVQQELTYPIYFDSNR